MNSDGQKAETAVLKRDRVKQNIGQWGRACLQPISSGITRKTLLFESITLPGSNFLEFKRHGELVEGKSY